MRPLNFAVTNVVVSLTLACLIIPANAVAPTPEPGMKYVPGQRADWREEYAYTLGVQAYIFGYPWIHMAALRWQWTNESINKFTAYAPINHFWHAKELVTAKWHDGGTPNNDTLYSIAWVDLTKEPVILSVPATGDRYYTMEIAGMSSDNFAYVGQRTTGNKAGHYAIVGPNWKGELPKGVKALPPSSSTWAGIFGRTLVKDAQDVLAVNALQEKYTLTPLSLWGKVGAQRPTSRDVWKPIDNATDPLSHWKTMNRAMTESPPVAQHALLIKSFATIGVGPGLDIDALDEATKRGLRRAAAEGWYLLNAAGAASYHYVGGGWRYPPKTLGRAGLADNFIVRGGMQSLTGIVANDPEENVYISAVADGAGKPLDGGKRYVIHFGPADVPDVKAFWSLSLYGFDRNFVENAIDRYALGDRSPSLKKDADGGFSIYIQADSPEANKVGNWLPSTKGTERFYLILRAYIPGKGLIDQTWVPPAIQSIN